MAAPEFDGRKAKFSTRPPAGSSASIVGISGLNCWYKWDGVRIDGLTLLSPDMAGEFDSFPKTLGSFIDQHYPGLVQKFDSFPKTLGDFIDQRYTYLVQEFIEATRWQDRQIVYCT